MALAVPPFPTRTLLFKGKGAVIAHETFERDFETGEWYIQLQSIMMDNLANQSKFTVGVSCDCVKSHYRSSSGHLQSENQILFALPVDCRKNARDSFTWCPPVFFRLTNFEDNITLKFTTPTDVDFKDITIHAVAYLYKKK